MSPFRRDAWLISRWLAAGLFMWATGQKTTEYLDCSGCLVVPAAIDMHVHMRGGVQSAKEDWKSGSMSALAGGVTVVVDQPNTVPPITLLILREIASAMHRQIPCCNFAVNSSVTPKHRWREMWQTGAMAFGETFFAPSSYGDAIGMRH